MERIDVPKQTFGGFIFSEFIVFLSQIFVFFIVAAATSHLLTNEDKLVEFSSQKINSGSLQELLLTFLATFAVVGLLVAIERLADNRKIEFYINEILCEMPRTVYVFGSSATGVLLAISAFLLQIPEKRATAGEALTLSFMFASMIFLYGCALSYFFKRKTHILTRKHVVVDCRITE